MRCASATWGSPRSRSRSSRKIGLAIKQKSPFPRSFTIELANGSYGYLPTPRQHALGGYETWLGTNRVEKEASVKIAKGVLGLLGKLKK